MRAVSHKVSAAPRTRDNFYPDRSKQTAYEKTHTRPDYHHVHLCVSQSLGDAHSGGQSFTALVSDASGVHEALSELESIPAGLAGSRGGLLCICTDSQTQHPGSWDGLRRLDDDHFVSGLLSSAHGSPSSMLSVVRDEVG